MQAIIKHTSIGIMFYRILCWALFIPMAGMFIVPVVIYGGKLSINADSSVYIFDDSKILNGMLIVLVWNLILYICIGLLKIFRKSTEVAREPKLFRWIYKNYYWLTSLFILFYILHVLFITPIFIENIFHIISMQIFPILGIGVLYSKTKKTINYLFYIILFAGFFIVNSYCYW